MAASLGGFVLFANAPPSPSPSYTAERSAAAETIPSESASASDAITAITVADIEASADHALQLPVGSYELPEVQPPVSFAILSGPWLIDRVYPDGFNLIAPTHSGYVSGGVVQVVLNGPCKDSPTRAIASEPAALVAWLQANEWLSTTDPRPVNLGGWSGLQVDVGLARTVEGECGPPPSDMPPEFAERVEGRVFIFLFGEDDFWIAPDERVRLLTVDVGGKPFTILAGVDNSASFDAFIEATQPTLESIRFGPTE